MRATHESDSNLQPALCAIATLISMNAILRVTRQVQLPGMKKSWAINKPCDVIDCDEGVFVRVDPGSWCLTQVVQEDNAKDNMHARTIANSQGLATLLTRRNDMQAQLLAPDSFPSDECTLFDHVPQENKKRKHICRSELKAMRDNHKSLTIEVSINGNPMNVRVLRPVHPRDHLFVEFDKHALFTVLMYMRANEFDHVQPRAADDIPKGIHRQKDRYIVKYQNRDGSTKNKIEHSLENAIALKARIDNGEYNLEEEEEEKENYEPLPEAHVPGQVNVM